MPDASVKRIRVLILAALSTALLAACAIGPVEISLRGNAGSIDASSREVAQTVTAVYATNTQIAVLRTATAAAFVPPPPTVSSQATQPPPQPLDQPSFSAGDVRLHYTEDSLTLYNGTTRQLDIAGLTFRSDTGELDVTRWDNGYLTTSLYAFPPGDCLMAWTLDSDEIAKPADCGTRHAWIAVGNAQTFWQTDTTFSVYWYGQLITTCSAIAGSCDITLP